MLTTCFSHLDLMKNFPECNEANKWGEWMTSSRPGHSSHIRQPINRHICTEGNTNGVIRLEVNLKALDSSLHLGIQRP